MPIGREEDLNGSGHSRCHKYHKYRFAFRGHSGSLEYHEGGFGRDLRRVARERHVRPLEKAGRRRQPPCCCRSTASTPALADAKSTAEFVLATCCPAMKHVAKVDAVAREKNWTSEAAAGAQGNGFQTETWVGCHGWRWPDRKRIFCNWYRSMNARNQQVSPSSIGAPIYRCGTAAHNPQR
jgi:hypothetical protein